MRRIFGLVLHPISMIVWVNAVWTTALVFWILYFIRRYRQIERLAGQTGARPQDLISWAPLVVGIVLLAILFAGTVALILTLAKQAIVNRQMRNFLSFVSHELRTPITSLSLFLETMRDNVLSPEKEKEFIESMLRDTDRLSRQIGGILDASRLEHRRMPMRKELLDMEKFIRDFAKKKEPMVLAQGRELVLEEPQYCTVLGDRDALLTVVENLVRNAELYSDKGTRITLSLKESGRWAIIEVKDQGIGIEHKEAKKIFNLFYRSQSGREMTSRGSGLGLYIVKAIVGMHGGRVEVHSEGRGKGAIFAVRLPTVGSN